ncbi:MAG TPA: GNAT family N-acetyltransferase [Candidatus Saccharimonadales bacterium]|nr:GNAT family N-acetyltransferase [Candidatus Saccharimonadales bacterium]
MKPGEHIVEIGKAAFLAGDPLAISAARLLVSETIKNVDTPASNEQIGVYITDLHPGSAHYVIAGRQGGIVAAAWVRHGMSGSTHLHAIAVDPNERGQHYGSELMSYIAQMAIEHGDTNIDLYALSESEHFFRSLGFTSL